MNWIKYTIRLFISNFDDIVYQEILKKEENVWGQTDKYLYNAKTQLMSMIEQKLTLKF